MTLGFFPVVCVAAILHGRCVLRKHAGTGNSATNNQAGAGASQGGAVEPAVGGGAAGARAARAASTPRSRVRRRAAWPAQPRAAVGLTGGGGAGAGTGGGGGSGGSPTVSRSGMKSAGCGKDLMGATLNMFTNTRSRSRLRALHGANCSDELHRAGVRARRRQPQTAPTAKISSTVISRSRSCCDTPATLDARCPSALRTEIAGQMAARIESRGVCSLDSRSLKSRLRKFRRWRGLRVDAAGHERRRRWSSRQLGTGAGAQAGSRSCGW